MLLLVFLTILAQHNVFIAAYWNDPCETGKEFVARLGAGSKIYKWFKSDSPITYEEAVEACSCWNGTWDTYVPARISDATNVKWDRLTGSMGSSQRYSRFDVGPDPYFIGAVTGYKGEGEVPIEQISDKEQLPALAHYDDPNDGNCGGQDIDGFTLNTAEQCAALCNADAGSKTCVGFVFTTNKAYGKTCYRKYAMCDKPYTLATFSTYTKTMAQDDTPLDRYQAPEDGNCGGEDIDGFVVDTPIQCAALCNLDDNCLGFVFTTNRAYGKTCYRKHTLCDTPYALATFTTYRKVVKKELVISITASKVHDPSKRPLTLAIDGNTGNDGYSECTVVKAQKGTDDVWIQLDLGQVVDVTAVELLPREKDDKQLANFQIYVGSPADQLNDFMLCKSYTGKVNQDGKMKRFECGSTLTGQYITIKKTAGKRTYKYLTVCEMKVITEGGGSPATGLSKVGFTFDGSIKFVKVSGDTAAGALCETV